MINEITLSINNSFPTTSQLMLFLNVFLKIWTIVIISIVVEIERSRRSVSI